ncbi:MAG: glycerol acyltransferase, partial [Mycobacterium sp.]|nr:glycerol acyltransferase [Mycobacterium sp.]
VPVNMPLPAKIVAEVLEPIDVVAQWERHPDAGVIDGRVRRTMQAALDQMARRRRFPIIG